MNDDYRSRRSTAVILILLGSCCILLATALPLLLEAPVLGFFLGFFLMGLPLLFSGGVAFTHGWALATTRLTLKEHGLFGTIPTWRGFPAPPSRQVSIAWKAVQSIKHRREDYFLLSPILGRQGLRISLDVFLVKHEGGALVLAENMLPDVAQIVNAISVFSGIGIEECGVVSVGKLKALLGKTPDWDKQLTSVRGRSAKTPFA